MGADRIGNLNAIYLKTCMMDMVNFVRQKYVSDRTARLPGCPPNPIRESQLPEEIGTGVDLRNTCIL